MYDILCSPNLDLLFSHFRHRWSSIENATAASVVHGVKEEEVTLHLFVCCKQKQGEIFIFNGPTR